MQGVSGVTGAGPLLHRVVMETAKRHAPGALLTPAQAGAVSEPVCRLSGLRATPDCAQLTEWFTPGTAPTMFDDWEHSGHVTLPAEYAEWSQQQARPVTNASSLAIASVPEAATGRSATPRRFSILSPRDGDRYAIPPGVESRYSTLSLRAGGADARSVRWSIDGQPFTEPRWPLVAGTHVFRAVSVRGDTAEARVAVDR